MAENKKSFVLYSDSQGLVNQLPDDVAGRLFKHIYSYVNGEEPISDEMLINIAFEPIKMQLQRDLIKWEAQLEQRKQAGIKSAEVRKRNATSVNERSISSTVNDNVNVNVTTTTEEGKNNFVVVADADKIEYPDIDFDAPKKPNEIKNNYNQPTTLAPIISIETFEKEFLQDNSAIESLCMLYKLPIENIKPALKEFKMVCKAGGKDNLKTNAQFKSHFNNWVRKKLEIANSKQ